MSHGTCNTVKIKAEVTDENPDGVVIINESDFDPAVHELHETKAPEAPAQVVETAAADKPWIQPK
jgi:hypothetical protein